MSVGPGQREISIEAGPKVIESPVNFVGTRTSGLATKLLSALTST
jgi:hypothetical protein